jgi:hypothetical protein
MSTVQIKYPLDPTGVSPDNLVRDEPKALQARKVRVFVMNNGAFFTESLVVKDAATSRVLTRGVDYYASEMYELPTLRYGKEICAVVCVTDITCSSNVLVSAQMLGGEFSYAHDAVVQLVTALQLDDRPTSWGNIIGMPELFAPAPHLHDIGDVYGFEYLVQAVQRLGMAITLGSAAGENKILAYVDAKVDALQTAFNAFSQQYLSKSAILGALGFTPANKGGDSFDGPMSFNRGLVLKSYMKEAVVKITATEANTVLDLSQGSIFEITLKASTGIRFDTSRVDDLQPGESLSFTLILVNDVTAGRAVSFVSPTRWSGGLIPPRTTTANGRDEFYFSTFDSGASYTGSLSNQDAK